MSKSPPRLALAAIADGSSTILADKVAVTIKAEVFDAVIMLLACYFAWDLCYPRAYQLLSFLHIHVLGEHTNVRKCTSFVKLEKQLSALQ